MGTGVKEQIKEEIAATSDQNMKVVLLMLMGVLDEISSKIDTVLNDERGLREAVLNGHEPVHHSHHEYISRRIKHEPAEIAQAKWVAKKMQEEEDDAKAEKSAKRGLKYGMIERILWAALATVMAALVVLK